VNPHISVIVLNYNGRRWLGDCLTAVAGQAGAPPYEVLLADNGSSDGSLELVRAEFPNVRIVDNLRNLGFAAGNNAAAREARGTLLAFLNNDTIPAPDWLSRLHAAHVEAPDRALVTSRLVFLDRPEIVDSAGDGYLRAGGAYKRGHGENVEAFLRPGEVFGVCGAAFLIPRELFLHLGGFDEHFFMVYEDVDLSYRARLAGYRCWYAADAVVRHAGSGTLGTLSETAVFHGQRNLEWTWLKNTPASLMMKTLPIHVAYSLLGLAHYVSAGRGGAALAGKLSALRGVPRVLSERRAVQGARRTDARSIAQLIDSGWLSLKRREKSARLHLPDHQHR
jgi:N-acetylglucosaminyl-diphospho-decaprenol L-rhamnosyltransferase